jgi:hypothetical protein
MGRDTRLMSGALGASHRAMIIAKAGVLNTSIKETFRRVFCHMVGLVLKLGGLANRNGTLVQIIFELDMCNQICRFLQIFSIGSMLFFKVLELTSINCTLAISKSVQEFHVILK